jgi:transposase
MPAGISVDLRKRVMEAVDSGAGTIKGIAKRFAVGRRTIYGWLTLREKTNGIAPQVNYQKGHSHTIEDWEEFRKFVERHTHLTSPVMCIEWEKIYGKRIHKSVMKRGLKKLGYTFKKNSFATRNQVHKKELIFYKKSAK